MFLDPEKLSEAKPSEILDAAAKGHLGLDRRLLRALLDRPEEARAAVLDFGKQDRSDDVVDLTPELIGLLRVWKTPDAIPFLIEYIKEDPENIPDEAVEILVALGEPALEPVLALYNELEEEQSGEVAFILASLRIRDPRVLKALTARLDFDLADAVFLLGVYGDPAALQALQEAESQFDPSPEIRREIADAREALANETGPVAREEDKFDLWDLYPEKADVPVDLLDEDERLDLLSHALEAVRAAAANSFFNQELDDAQAAVLLSVAESDESPIVRARAWESLMLVTENTAVVEAMLRTLRTPGLPVEERSGLVVGLSAETDRNEVRAAIDELYGVEASRAKAMEAMWRSMHASFRDRFALHLEDKDTEIRRAALWGAGYFGLRSEVDRIRDMFSDEELRSDALFAYALALPGDVSKGRMKGLLAKIEKDAGGLSEMEEELVKTALDEKLMLAGKEPFFAQQED